MVTTSDITRFMRLYGSAVLATVSDAGKPEAALIAFACTNALEIVFDTSTGSRKYSNLKRSGVAAVVVTSGDKITVQYEGTATELAAGEAASYKPLLFRAVPEARERERWPDTAYFKVTPRWIRYSDFRSSEPLIKEFNFDDADREIGALHAR